MVGAACGRPNPNRNTSIRSSSGYSGQQAMKWPFMLILSFIFGVVVLGTISLHSDVVVLSIPLVAYLFAAILRRPEEIKLSVTREMFPDYAPQGTPITVKV